MSALVPYLIIVNHDRNHQYHHESGLSFFIFFPSRWDTSTRKIDLHRISPMQFQNSPNFTEIFQLQLINNQLNTLQYPNRGFTKPHCSAITSSDVGSATVVPKSSMTFSLETPIEVEMQGMYSVRRRVCFGLTMMSNMP